VRVANPGKKLADFVPGEALENTYTIYRNALPAGAPSADFKVISHVEQLARSSCARNSGGRLWCGTCHNPHEPLATAVESYRSRCLSCHTAVLPAHHPAKDSDCMACHMPRRDAKDGGHTAFTDHRIQRRPDTPVDLPSDSEIAAWREPPPELQERNLGIAYIDVGMQRHSAPFVIRGYRALTEVQNQFADDSVLFKWIGEALLLGKQTADAKLAFERALELDPDSALAEASAASPYIQEGDDRPAIAHLRRAMDLDPLSLPTASTLIGLYRNEGQTEAASELSNQIQMAMTEHAGPSSFAANGSPATMSEAAFKNIQVLKGIPADQLIPAMQFMSSSLGVECGFCHVEDHFEKDDKKAKQTARKMMRMMFDLNSTSFLGQREITCYSCHRGSPDPANTPILASARLRNAQPDPAREAGLPKSLPTVKQLLDRYVGALGGAAAIQKVSSRVQRGSMSSSGGQVRIEIYAESPKKWAFIRHLPAADSIAAFDGNSGWSVIPQRPLREMPEADVDGARMDADLQFPLHIQSFFPDLRVEYPEVIGARAAYVLFATKDRRPAAKLYFDQQSGLLARTIRYGDSPLGLNPLQIDYADYREVSGVQLPFQVILRQPGGSSTIQFDEIHENVPIDSAIFSRPPVKP